MVGAERPRPRRAREAPILGPIPPLWPYTWGRALRFLGGPIDLLYRVTVVRTVVLGGHDLRALSSPLIFAGTHRGYVDLHAVRHGLLQTPARALAGRLVVVADSQALASAGWLLARYGVVALGLYPFHRYGRGVASLERLAELASRGNPLVIFPQGLPMRPHDEQAGDPRTRFRLGVARLALDLGASVVPFGLAGSERIVPPFPDEFDGPLLGGIPLSLRRAPVAVAFGAPITPMDDEGVRDFTRRVQEASFALSRQAEAALS